MPLLKTGQEERKYSELLAKIAKADAARERSEKAVREKLERDKIAREHRFERLLANVCGDGTVAHQTAKQIQDRNVREKHRCQELHDAWEEQVFQPLASQAHRHLNPPNRALIQSMSGFKSVDFQLPTEVFRMNAGGLDDPMKKDLTEHAREMAFQQAAHRVLSGSASAPELSTNGGSPSSGGQLLSPKAMSKAMLDPTAWNAVPLHGSMLGRFAQVCEQGPGFRRDRRGGSSIFLPDESDGVASAGTKHDRVTGRHDKGILRGDRAAQGTTAELRRSSGAGSGAPAQDHYTFSTGRGVTDLEFPLGKRTFGAM